jgi:hypothetical protein
MSSKSKSQLRTENSNNFPNNNSQFITPEKLRGFNNDVIDSLVVSSDTGSYVTTSSFDNGTRIQTFTKADGTTYTNSIPDATVSTGSLLTTSSFDDGTRLMTFTKGDGSTYTNSIPGGDETGSLLTTASVVDATITYTKGDGTTFTNTINNVVNATSASHAEFADETDDVILNVKNTSGADIGKGLAVHATGVTGENVNIKLADSSVSGDMPAIGITRDAISNNASGVVILSGKVRGLNTATDGLVAGAAVYVNGAGVLTSTKPTGSDLIQNIGICGKVNATDGEIIVVGSGRSNDLPNITEGYIWLGNGDGVPEEFSTGSIAFTNKNNTFTGTQNFNNISVSGTGSFAYIQSVTGSAKVIGDAFIVLNNDTPTERYAGIVVQDSGSGAPLTTSSFQYDGQTDDWFYEYSQDGGITVDHGVALFGPEYNTKGSPTYNASNKVLKGTGGHHIVDSNITDDGSTVSITGDLSVSGEYKGFDSSSFAILNQPNTFTGGPQLVSGSNGYVKQVLGPLAPNTEYKQTAVFGAENGGDAYNQVFQGLVNFGTSVYEDAYAIEYFDSTSYNFGTGFYLNGKGVEYQVVPNGGGFAKQAKIRLQDDGDNTSTLFMRATDINIGTTGTGNITIGSISTPVTINTSGISIDSIGVIGITGSVDISDNLSLPGISNVSESIASASVSGGGGASGIFEQTGSFYSTTNDLQVTGSFGVSKAIGGKNSDLTITSNTASIDLTQSNTYTVTLVSSADTHLDVSTFGETAQSVNVLVKQPAAGNTGSISFSPDFKFGQGYSYKPTPSNSSEDILSFTRFGNSLYGTYINNFN